MKKTIAEVSKETLMIENVLKTLEPDEFIEYSKIQELSGVTMDNIGRARMRSALNRLKLEYACISGKGIRIAGKESAMSIIGHRVIKIDKTVRRASKTTERITEKHFHELSNEEKKHAAYLAGVFGAIRQYSKGAKLIFQKEPIKLANS